MLTATRLYLRYPGYPSDGPKLDVLAELVYGDAVSASKKLRELDEVGVVVRVREGSLEIVSIITTSAVCLVQAIASYGEIRQGLREVKQDAGAAGKWLREKLKGNRLPLEKPEKTRITTGKITQLLLVTRKVETGRLSASEGHQKMLHLLALSGENLSEELEREILRLFSGIHSPTASARPDKLPKGMPKKVKRPRTTREFEQEIEIRREFDGTKKKVRRRK